MRCEARLWIGRVEYCSVIANWSEVERRSAEAGQRVESFGDGREMTSRESVRNGDLRHGIVSEPNMTTQKYSKIKRARHYVRIHKKATVLHHH